MKEILHLKHNIWSMMNSISDELCDLIVEQFEMDKHKQFEGKTVGGVNPIKKATDLIVTNSKDPKWQNIDQMIFKEISESIKIFLENNPPLQPMFFMDSGYQITRYNPNVDKYDWHVDLDHPDYCHRQVVLITYLNDVEKGGETEFQMWDYKIKPYKGRTIFFPPFWTHPHKGYPPISGPKYIMTTALLLIQPPENMNKEEIKDLTSNYNQITVKEIK